MSLTVRARVAERMRRYEDGWLGNYDTPNNVRKCQQTIQNSISASIVQRGSSRHPETQTSLVGTYLLCI